MAYEQKAGKTDTMSFEDILHAEKQAARKADRETLKLIQGGDKVMGESKDKPSPEEAASETTEKPGKSKSE